MKIAQRCICCDGAHLARSPAILMPFVANRVFGWTPAEVTPEWGLQTVPTGMAYPLCNSLQCQDCGALFLDMRFDEEEMAALYAGYRGEAYAAARDRFEPGYRARNDAIMTGVADSTAAEAFLGPHVPAAPCVLDWGGDSGRNTPFRDAGGIIEIFDISGQPVIPGARRVGKAELTSGYDLIVLSHVLEHTPHPAAMLADIRAVMDARSTLYIEVPYETLIAQAPDARDLAGRKRHWHEHINFFTEESLKALLALSGLQVEALSTPAIASHANFSQVMAVACRLG